MTNEELLAAIDSRFEANERRWEQNERRWEANDGRWDVNDNRLENVETDVRQWHVLFESVQGQIQRIAEAVALVDERLERFRIETNRRFDQLTPFA